MGRARAMDKGKVLNRKRRLASLLAAVALALLVPLAPASAQELRTGLMYFAVENKDLRRVTERGIAGSAGTAFTNLTLAPSTRYRVWILHAESLDVGWVEFRTPATGTTFQIPPIALRLPSSHDTDGDLLHDQGEFVINSDPPQIRYR